MSDFLAHANIDLLTTVVDEILGVEEKQVRAIRIRNVKNDNLMDPHLSGFFLGIGHVPTRGNSMVNRENRLPEI
jgi:thioredoxin reductase (NADPH)